MNNSANPNEPERDSMVTLETVKNFFLWQFGKDKSCIWWQNDILALINYNDFLEYCRDNNLLIQLAKKE